MGPALQTLEVAGIYLLEVLDLVRVSQVHLDVQPGNLDTGTGRVGHNFIFTALE